MREAGDGAQIAITPHETRADSKQQRQKMLFKTEAWQTAIFGNVNFSGIATDERGVIQVFNVGAERMLGYAANEVVNRVTPADISDPEALLARARVLSHELAAPVAPGFEALVFKARRGIEDFYELTYIRKDGSLLPAVVSVTALQDVAGNIIGYLLIGTDNTAMKQIESERDRLDEVLRESQLELQITREAAERANLAQSDFLSAMSHELRTPLNAILGFAQLMEMGSPQPTPGQQDSIDQILQAGWHLLALISESLDPALTESGKPPLSIEPMLLPELLAEALPVTLAPVQAGTASYNLLCVEDNPANLKLVEQLIERRPDIRMLSACDGRLGVETARAHLPDVILMDINLPGISGFTAMRILAEDPATAHIPVIALSANARPRDIEMGLEAGFFRYLTKPIKVGELMDTLDAALHQALDRATTDAEAKYRKTIK